MQMGWCVAWASENLAHGGRTSDEGGNQTLSTNAAGRKPNKRERESAQAHPQRRRTNDSQTLYRNYTLSQPKCDHQIV